MAPFLTALNSRAEVKGSRDPLGIQSIWSHIGRHVVGNLTTVTTSVRDFTVLMLGFHFAEQVEEFGGKASFVDTLLQWELADYARASTNGGCVFRWTERVKKLRNEDSKVTLSAQPALQIFGSQRQLNGSFALTRFLWPGRLPRRTAIAGSQRTGLAPALPGMGL